MPFYSHMDREEVAQLYNWITFFYSKIKLFSYLSIFRFSIHIKEFLGIKKYQINLKFSNIEYQVEIFYSVIAASI